MNHINLAITGTLLLSEGFFALQAAESKATDDRPNVVIVITDDQGMGDLSCMGNPYIKTPNIDNFYKDAVRLTNFHVSTTSAPSRGALMTGRHSNRINVFHTISGRSLLYEDEVIIPQILAQNGYTNGMFGKWHLGDNYPLRPEDRGFHEVVRHGGGGVGQGPDYWSNDYFDDTYWHNGKTEKYEGYCTDIFFNEAINFIEKNKDRPFFCYIATNAPHGPLNVPVKYKDKYKNIKDIDEHVKRFYAMITNIDDNFKRLQNKLNDLHLTDNTILIFMTDNGTATGQKIYNWGMRGGKGSEYDGGHRVPFFIRWPKGNITGGKDIDRLTAHYDLLPTLVDLLHISYNPQKPLDGRSWKPLLYGQENTWSDRMLYMDTQRLQNLVKYRKYAVMDEHWRLVNGNELYNIDNDRGQTKNVIDTYPEVASRLAESYERWWLSLMSENVDEHCQYIKVGTPYENPTRISGHDLFTFSMNAWNQTSVVRPSPASGKWKIEFVETGNYKISLCRFPRESGLAINATFDAEVNDERFAGRMAASVKSDFVKASFHAADIDKTVDIRQNDREVSFTVHVSEGKYDMEASLIDAENRVFPAYYIYIEKLK